jgi:DNA polymerase-3 subunit alpha
MAQKLAGERETLGHYLSGHPTDAWRNLIEQVATCPIGDIERHYTPPPANRASGERRGHAQGQPFVLAGQVVALRKRGDSMAFARIEDWSGRLEISLFRDAWAEYGALLTRDAILVFDGGLSIDDFNGGWQLRVNHVQTIDAACERHARLLRVSVNGVGPGFSGRLHQALAEHRGGHTAVRLAIRNSEGRGEIELGPEWQVRAGPSLTRAVEAVDGVLAAELLYGSATGAP